MLVATAETDSAVAKVMAWARTTMATRRHQADVADHPAGAQEEDDAEDGQDRRRVDAEERSKLAGLGSRSASGSHG